jgi:hypothetical protein
MCSAFRTDRSNAVSSRSGACDRWCESGREARECDYEWVLNIREQCVKVNKTFWFKNTGSLFKREGILKKINPFKQTAKAKEFGINILNGQKLF